MPLPTPSLDDRTFQDLVDEAKRYVQSTFPDWTDHNVSDPGVTLIETFAMMVDQLIYRLNRVPERHYVKFLELIGVRLLPPAPARGAVTFWLSTAQAAPVTIRAGTEVATDRTDVDEPVVFTTSEELLIPPCSLTRMATATASGPIVDRTQMLQDAMDGPPRPAGDGSGGDVAAPSVPVFSDVPVVGDALLLGLSVPVPRCAVRLEFDGPVGGIGIDPRRPPLTWEAWTPTGWVECDVDHDDTGGFNRAGDVLLHVPSGHTESLLAGTRSAWLRCRVTDGQPAYQRTPQLSTARATTIGGTAPILNAVPVADEILGTADGAASGRFRISRAPVVAADSSFVLDVVPRGGEPQRWQQMTNFGSSGEDDRHYRLDPASGEVEFGPLVRTGDGRARRYGAIPPMGATVVARRYTTGGGRRGNVGTGLIRVLKTSVPYVHAVVNRRPTTGGADGETPDEAKIRGPLELRASGRAVTADDFEELALAAAPKVARVRCVPASRGEAAVRVLVVPFVPVDAAGRVAYDDVRAPDAALLTAIARHLDERRLVGTRLLVTPPAYQGVTVVARLAARRGFDAAEVQAAAVRAINDYLSPLDGGPDATGWPFGRPVNDFEVSGVLAGVRGVDLVEEVLLFPADPGAGRRGEPSGRVGLAPDALAFSYQPQVRVDVVP
jgi:predicted phage baseplate assembly protein